jgi:aspartyl-tRNA(Asn)/glutamyl-tRNA(Gln) amidotransferase subunit A
VAYASSLDQIGPLAKDVTDCATLLGVISGHDARDSTSVQTAVPDYRAGLRADVKGLRIGKPVEYFGQGLAPDVREAVEGAIEQLARWGAEIVEVSLPHTDYAIADFYILAMAEASSNLARYDGLKYGYRSAGEAGDLEEVVCRTRALATKSSAGSCWAPTR